MIKGLLTALDGEFITTRTGTSIKKVETSRLPKHGDYIPFIYLDNESESPGVMVATDNVTIEGNTYYFNDEKGRHFKLEIEE